LVPATAELARAEVDDRARFGKLLEAEVPDNWPPELAADAIEWFAQQLEADPSRAGWMGWYGVILDKDRPVLGLGGGFLGPPKEGAVEVGYSALPQFYRQGYGGEMVRALVNWALSREEVVRVYADVATDNVPSLALLRRLGFVEKGVAAEPGHIRVEKDKTGAP
jgi:RimJ/RimL family protein N-acetyltransferase